MWLHRPKSNEHRRLENKKGLPNGSPFGCNRFTISEKVSRISDFERFASRLGYSEASSFIHGSAKIKKLPSSAPIT
jgi:hypothetical protein